MDSHRIKELLRIATGELRHADMAAALRELDALRSQSTLPKDLDHYLQRRSYGKALAWLETASDGQE